MQTMEPMLVSPVRMPKCDVLAAPAIATAFPDATSAAREALRSGGNAVDAAVAAAWALAVCEPSASGLGGQGIALVHFGEKTFVLDGHSFAPCGVSEERITRSQQRAGYAACTIPSMPAMLDHLHARFGVLDRNVVMAPAIALATNGYRLTALQARQIKWSHATLRESGIADCFVRGDEPLKQDDVVRQPALACTLQHLAAAGVRDFYEGDVASAIAQDMRAHGGLVTARDLASYDGPFEVSPLEFEYRKYRVVTAGPPAGGLYLALALKILEQLGDLDRCDPEMWFSTIAFATFASFLQRENAPLSGDQWGHVEAREHLSTAAAVRAINSAVRALDSTAADVRTSNAEEPGDTTHLTVADAHGNVVGLTLSIQSSFGAKVATPSLGFFYNNYLRTCPRTPHPQRLAPGCRPRSNAAPVMLFHGSTESAPWLSLGAAGSRRIVSSILQVISRVVDRAEPLTRAVAAPRIHALLNRHVWIERPAATQALMNRLDDRFCPVRVKPRHSYSMGAVHALLTRSGRLEAAADPRRDGSTHMGSR